MMNTSNVEGSILIYETQKKAAVYMEKTAKSFLLAKACGEPDVLTKEQPDNAAEIF